MRESDRGDACGGERDDHEWTPVESTADVESHLRSELAESRRLLREEQRRTRMLSEDLKSVKERSLQAQKQLEEEEEAIMNKLMKRLEQLQREKEDLSTKVQVEEDFLRQGELRLREVDREKQELQRQLELEQEYVVNKLEKKLNELNVEKTKLGKYKVDLENQLEQEQEQIVNKLQKRADKYLDEKLQLVSEKTDLQRHVTTLQSQVAKLSSDKVVLENQLEAEEESIVNRLQRQLEKVLHKNRALEKRLEKGKYLSESETSEDEASLFHEHYASFMTKSMKAMHRSQLNYSKHSRPSSSRPSSRDMSRPSSRELGGSPRKAEKEGG